MLNGITLGIIITFLVLFFCIVLSILVNAILAPFTKTPANILDEIADLIDLKEKDVFMDLGSGDGRLVFKAYERSLCKCFGYDISPILIIYSNVLRLFKFPTAKDITFEVQNIFKLDISKATKIYCYLDEKSLNILEPKLKEFVKKGGEVYSYIWAIQGLEKEKKVELDNKKELYIYKK